MARRAGPRMNAPGEQARAIEAFAADLVRQHSALACRDCRVMGDVTFVLSFQGDSVQVGVCSNSVERLTGDSPLCHYARRPFL
jgi:hypothetical protein